MDNQSHKLGAMGGMVAMGIIALIAHLMGDSAFYIIVSIIIILEFIGLGYEMNNPPNKPKRKQGKYFRE